MSSDTDDIDAGWDEEPSSAGHAAAAQQARSGFSESPLATPVSAFHALNDLRAGSSHSLTPAEVGARGSVRPTCGGGRAVLPVAAVFVLAAGALLWVRREPKLETLSSKVIATVAEPRAAVGSPAAEPADAPLIPDAPPPPAPASAGTARPDTPAEAGSIEPLVLYAPETSNVTVTSTPSGAVFFESGTRLGSGQITVRSGSKSKRYLTALLSGYAPLNFRVDGTKPVVTVKLTPAEASKVTEPERDAPPEAPVSRNPATE
jgi:hypothetical protein